MKRVDAPVTIIVLSLCVLVYCLMFLSGHTDSEGMILFGAYYKPFIITGDWWRFVTCGFVHANILHLAMNMVSLYSLGTLSEKLYGSKNYAVILFGSIACGSAFVYAGQGNVLMVGLSAGLYGLMTYYIVLLIHRGAWKVPAGRNAIMRMVSINLLINLVPGVSWVAHLGGAAGGFLLGNLLLNKDKRDLPVTIVLVVSLVFLCVHNSMIKDNEMYLKSDYDVLKTMEKYIPAYAERKAQKLDALYGTGNILEEALHG